MVVRVMAPKGIFVFKHTTRRGWIPEELTLPKIRILGVKNLDFRGLELRAIFFRVGFVAHLLPLLARI
jgi:hypothetical protein